MGIELGRLKFFEISVLCEILPYGIFIFVDSPPKQRIEFSDIAERDSSAIPQHIVSVIVEVIVPVS